MEATDDLRPLLASRHSLIVASMDEEAEEVAAIRAWATGRAVPASAG